MAAPRLPGSAACGEADDEFAGPSTPVAPTGGCGGGAMLPGGIPARFAPLFEDFEPERFDNAVTALVAEHADSATLELAGRLKIAKTKRAAGTLRMYLLNFSHRLTERVRMFISANIDALQRLLDSSDELNYADHDLISASALVNMYLMTPHYGDVPCESPLQMHLRIAAHFFADRGYQRVVRAWKSMAKRLYTHASPTLFNAGTVGGQCASCFLISGEDSMDGIFEKIVGNTARISQNMGGIGIGLSMIRHGSIAGGRGRSNGVPPVLRLIDKTIVLADQTGKRPGAATVHLAAWHRDVWEFVNATNKAQAAQLHCGHLNTSVWLPDAFMRAYVRGEDWVCFCPATSGLYGLHGDAFDAQYAKVLLLHREREAAISATKAVYDAASSRALREQTEAAGKACVDARSEYLAALRGRIEHVTHSAEDLMHHIASMERKSGFPYVMYGDAINAKSNQLNIGTVNSSNLCTEITEVSDANSIASCNLASINLRAFARAPFDAAAALLRLAGDDDDAAIVAAVAASGAFDFGRLGSVTREIVENIDVGVISGNAYPVERLTKETNESTRPQGIGVSGLADVFAVLRVPYESRVAAALNKGIFACIYFNAVAKSCHLAVLLSPYAKFATGAFTLPRAAREPPPRGTRPPVSVVDNGDGTVAETFSGSPAANGFFQFDLWARDAGVQAARGRLEESVYRRADDVPIAPAAWGQVPFWLTHGNETLSFRPAASGDDAAMTSLFVEPTWESLRAAVLKHGMRNSLLTTIMPTASTAAILRNAEATEAHTANLYTRVLLHGRFDVINQHFVRDMEELGLWNDDIPRFLKLFDGSLQQLPRFLVDFGHLSAGDAAMQAKVAEIVERYKTMFEISQMCVLRYARQRGIYIDQTQSTNIYLSAPDLRTIAAVHLFGWRLRLKTGIYYLRQQPKTKGDHFGIPARLLAYKKSLEGGGAGAGGAGGDAAPPPAAGGAGDASPPACAAPPAADAGGDDCVMCGS
jgi:ribonucleotide reductase alpha subunit